MRSTQLKRGSEVLISDCKVATSFFRRFLGLMGRKGIGADEALAFPRCNSIHMFFMRFPIDVVFTSDDGTIVDMIDSLSPWRMLMPRRKANIVFELQAGQIKKWNLQKGQQLLCEGVIA